MQEKSLRGFFQVFLSIPPKFDSLTLLSSKNKEREWETKNLNKINRGQTAKLKQEQYKSSKEAF